MLPAQLAPPPHWPRDQPTPPVMGHTGAFALGIHLQCCREPTGRVGHGDGGVIRLERQARCRKVHPRATFVVVIHPAAPIEPDVCIRSAQNLHPQNDLVSKRRISAECETSAKEVVRRLTVRAGQGNKGIGETLTDWIPDGFPRLGSTPPTGTRYGQHPCDQDRNARREKQASEDVRPRFFVDEDAAF